MAQIPPIEDGYIDDVIKSHAPFDPDLDQTQGVKMRELVKLMRDRLEQEITENFQSTTLSLQSKVDKEAGKGLSEENFTSTLKTKLEELALIGTPSLNKVIDDNPSTNNITKNFNIRRYIDNGTTNVEILFEMTQTGISARTRNTLLSPFNISQSSFSIGHGHFFFGASNNGLSNGEVNIQLSKSGSGIKITDTIHNYGLGYTHDVSEVGKLDDNWIPSYKAVKDYVDENSQSGSFIEDTVTTWPRISADLNTDYPMATIGTQVLVTQTETIYTKIATNRWIGTLYSEV